MLINLTIMYAASIQDNNKIFSIIINVMVSLAFIQFCMIVQYHFFTYTLNVAIEQKLIKIFTSKKRSSRLHDVALLNIPEHTNNYSEYQDGLVSDDFK